MKRFALALLPFLLLGCSVYRSEGRRYLEEYALDPNVIEQKFFQGCTTNNEVSSYSPWSSDERALTYVAHSDPARLRVIPLKQQQQDMACDFQFTSAQELSQLAELSIQISIAKTNGSAPN